MELRLIEAGSEIGAGTRGTSMGMAALRVAAWKNGSELFSKVEETVLRNENEVLYEEDRGSPNAHHIDGLLRFGSDLAYEVFRNLRQDLFVITIGGDHSIAIGSISGSRMALRSGNLGVVWIDAHADMHSPWSTPSGNVHGMPLALLMDLDVKGMNRPRKDTLNTWNRLREIGPDGPKVLPENLVIIGLRDYEAEELRTIERHRIKVVRVDEVRSKGPEAIVRETLEYLGDCHQIHVSFDVDSLDPSVSAGTGTPVPDGLKLGEAAGLLTGFCADPKVRALDVVEINPALDTKNAMAEQVLTILDPLYPIIRNR